LRSALFFDKGMISAKYSLLFNELRVTSSAGNLPGGLNYGAAQRSAMWHPAMRTSRKIVFSCVAIALQ